MVINPTLRDDTQSVAEDALESIGPDFPWLPPGFFWVFFWTFGSLNALSFGYLELCSRTLMIFILPREFMRRLTLHDCLASLPGHSRNGATTLLRLPYGTFSCGSTQKQILSRVASALKFLSKTIT